MLFESPGALRKPLVHIIADQGEGDDAVGMSVVRLQHVLVGEERIHLFQRIGECNRSADAVGIHPADEVFDAILHWIAKSRSPAFLFRYRLDDKCFKTQMRMPVDNDRHASVSRQFVKRFFDDVRRALGLLQGNDQWRAQAQNVIAAGE